MNEQIVRDLVTYYTKTPDRILISKLIAIFDKIPEDQHEKVVDWIVEHQPKKAGLDIPIVMQVISEMGISLAHAQETPQRWTCDLCGLEFNRLTVSDDNLRKQGLHDYCPRCGLPPAETLSAMRYYNAHGEFPGWYERLKKSYRDTFLAPGMRPRYDRKADEEWERQQQAQKIERMKRAFSQEVSNLSSAKGV